MKSRKPKYQVSGETPTQEEIQMSRMQAIQGLIDQGVNDPEQMLEFLNFDEQGNEIGDFTIEEIMQYIGDEGEGESEEYYEEEEPPVAMQEEEEEPVEEEEEAMMRYGGMLRRYQAQNSQVPMNPTLPSSFYNAIPNPPTITPSSFMSNDTAVESRVNEQPTIGSPTYQDYINKGGDYLGIPGQRPAWTVKKWTKEELDEMHKKQKGKHKFRKFWNKLVHRSKGSGKRPIPKITGMFGPCQGGLCKEEGGDVYADYGYIPAYNDGGSYIGFGWQPMQAKMGTSTENVDSPMNKAKAYRDTKSYTNYLKENFTGGIKDMATEALNIKNMKNLGIPVKDPLENAVYKKGGTFKKFQATNSQTSSNPFDQNQFNTYMDEYIKAHPDSFHGKDVEYYNAPGTIMENPVPVRTADGRIIYTRYPGDPDKWNQGNNQYPVRDNGYLGWGYPDGNYRYVNGIPAYYENRGGYGYGMGGYDPLSFLQGMDPRGFKNFKGSNFMLPFFRRSKLSFDYYGDPSQGTNYGTDYNKTNMPSNTQPGQDINQDQGEGKKYRDINMFKDAADWFRSKRNAKRQSRGNMDSQDNDNQIPTNEGDFSRKGPGNLRFSNDDQYMQMGESKPWEKVAPFKTEKMNWFQRNLTPGGRKKMRDLEVMENLRQEQNAEYSPNNPYSKEGRGDYGYYGSGQKKYGGKTRKYQVTGMNNLAGYMSAETQPLNALKQQVAFTPPNIVPGGVGDTGDDFYDPNAQPSPGPTRDQLAASIDPQGALTSDFDGMGFAPKRFNIRDTEFDGTGLYYGMHNFGNKVLTRMNNAETANRLRERANENSYDVFGAIGPENRGDRQVNTGQLRPDQNVVMQFPGAGTYESQRYMGGYRPMAQSGMEFFDQEEDYNPDDQLGGEYTYMTDDEIEQFMRDGGELEFY